MMLSFNQFVGEGVDPYTRMGEIKRTLDHLSRQEKKLSPGPSSERKSIAIQRQKLEREHKTHWDKLHSK